MKKIICFVVVMMMLSAQVLAATYYDVNVEGLTYSEKEELIEWLEDEGMEYDVESYTSNSSNTSNSNKKELVVEELSNSQKNTLVSWLKNRDYDYSTKTKNGYYYVTVEYTSSTKSTLIDYLDDKEYEYDSSDTSDSNKKELIVEELSNSQKNTLVSWLKNRDYDYSAKTKNGYYYVTVEYTSSTKSTLINYLDDKDYEYDTKSSNSSSDRTGKAYLVANGVLWYADGDDIEKVDTIYSPEYVLFTKDGGIAYINESKKGMYIEDLDEPTESEEIAKSVKSITTNSSGYAISFKGSSSKTTEIDTDDFNNDAVTVYVVKSNTLYSLSEKNKLTKLKSLKSVSSNSVYSKNYSNIGFSEWGDLVFIDSYGICFYNEEIDETDRIETLKDQDDYTVKAKYLTVSNGVIKTITLTDGSVVKLEDD